MSIGVLAGNVVGTIVPGLFGSNPRDPARKSEVDVRANAARRGDVKALVALLCSTGEPRYTDLCIQYEQQYRTGYVDAKNRHGYATTESKNYAKSVVQQLEREGVLGLIGEPSGIGYTLGTSGGTGNMGVPGVQNFLPQVVAKAGFSGIALGVAVLVGIGTFMLARK